MRRSARADLRAPVRQLAGIRAVTYVSSQEVTERRKVRATGSLDPSTNTFGGPFETQIFDLSNNVLDTLTGTVSAVRIPSEP